MFLSFIILISAIPANASVNDINIQSCTEYIEITNIEELTERAAKGITDIPLAHLPNLKVTAQINGNGESFKLSSITTCQILSKTTTKDGDNEMTIVITSIFGVDKDAFSSKSGGIDYNYTWDGSYGVKAYSSNYYSIDNNGEYRLDKITGGWIVYDSTLGIENRYVTYGQAGASSDAPGGWTQSNGTLSPSGNYSLTTYYVYHINMELAGGMGNTSTVDVFRWLNPNVTWELELVNLV